MTCWISIPIKDLAACKTRLRAVLDDGARESLVSTMLHHVTDIVRSASDDCRLLLLAPHSHKAPPAFEHIDDDRQGLNEELMNLLNRAVMSGAARLIIVPADLPLIAEADVQALMDVPSDHMAIAPDRAMLGTNALSLPLPAARDFRFQFGPGSFECHRIEASRLALPLTMLRSEGLAFDVDEPADLADLWEQQPHFYPARDSGRQRAMGGGGAR